MGGAQAGGNSAARPSRRAELNRSLYCFHFLTFARRPAAHLPSHPPAPHFYLHSDRFLPKDASASPVPMAPPSLSYLAAYGLYAAGVLGTAHLINTVVPEPYMVSFAARPTLPQRTR